MATATESDVEQKILWDLLTHPDFLSIPHEQIATKRFIPTRDIGKGSTAKRGFAPDYLVYANRLPILVVEAKSPDYTAEFGYGEARLYAGEMNAAFPSGVNPIRFILSSNGLAIYFGPSDAGPEILWDISKGLASSPESKELRRQIGWHALEAASLPLSLALDRKRYFTPAFLFGGQKRLDINLGQNSFSDALAPVIRKYFDAETPEEKREIIKYGYVDSELTTRYARSFEAFLKDRALPSAAPAKATLEPQRRAEPNFSAALADYSSSLPSSGSLQLLIGAVGAGKTSFVERFQQHLQPTELREHLFWCHVDFNDAPPDPSAYQAWMCGRFVAAFKKSYFDNDPTIQMAVFSDRLKDFNFTNFLIKDSDPHEYNRQLSIALADWKRDPITFASSACRYLIGDQRVGVVVVFDNTDKRNRDQQLRIFELAQWFKSETRSCCVIALRDETYERYKSEPPLDTFLHSNHFFIRAPRFIDIVRKRLTLAVQSLDNTSTLSAGVSGVGRVKIAKEHLSSFLDSIFQHLFSTSQRKISWVAEGLAGKNARQALQIFTRLIYSPHIDEKSTILASEKGSASGIPEHAVLNALMKTNYLYFSESHGYVSNVINFSGDTTTSDNFIRLEILQFLVDRRKLRGDLRIEGYFLSSTICERLGHMGYSQRDTLKEITWAVSRGLLTADHFDDRPITEGDAVKANASAFVHTNILLDRLGYIANCLLTAKLFSKEFAERVAEVWNIQKPLLDMPLERKREITKGALEYFALMAAQREAAFPLAKDLSLAAPALLSALQRAVEFRPKARDATLFPRR